MGKSPLYKKWEKVSARYLLCNEQSDLLAHTDDIELVWRLAQEYANERQATIYIFNKQNDEVSGVAFPKKPCVPCAYNPIGIRKDCPL